MSNLALTSTVSLLAVSPREKVDKEIASAMDTEPICNENYHHCDCCPGLFIVKHGRSGTRYLILLMGVESGKRLIISHLSLAVAVSNMGDSFCQFRPI
jgi:hypothetical protein